LHAYACYSGKVINLAKPVKERLTCEAMVGGEVEGDDWALLKKDAPARCSPWRQVNLLAER